MIEQAKIRPLQQDDLRDLGALYQEGIPHAVFCTLGSRFIEAFFGAMINRSDVCGLAAVDPEGKVLGVIIGTVDRSEAYKAVLRQRRWKLVAAAGARLFSHTVVLWVLRGLFSRLLSRAEAIQMPDAELLLIAVRPSWRGTKLAYRLVDHMEEWFQHAGFSGDYSIFTEADNKRANRFYEKLGARLMGSRRNRGLIINCYRKAISQSG